MGSRTLPMSLTYLLFLECYPKVQNIPSFPLKVDVNQLDHMLCQKENCDRFQKNETFQRVFLDYKEQRSEILREKTSPPAVFPVSTEPGSFKKINFLLILPCVYSDKHMALHSHLGFLTESYSAILMGNG